MKIYNEVVYHVVDDNLVKVSEDFFEYKGEVLKCNTSRSATRGMTDQLAVNLEETAKSTRDTFTEGPGGTTKTWTDTARDISQKASHHAFGSTMPGKDSEDNYEQLTYTAGEDESEADLNIETPEQELLRGRQYANLTQGQTARSLLTENIS